MVNFKYISNNLPKAEVNLIASHVCLTHWSNNLSISETKSNLNGSNILLGIMGHFYFILSKTKLKINTAAYDSEKFNRHFRGRKKKKIRFEHKIELVARNAFVLDRIWLYFSFILSLMEVWWHIVDNLMKQFDETICYDHRWRQSRVKHKVTV